MAIKESKEDLWKLRKKEKKIETTATIEKIRKLGNIAEKVKVILDREKEKIEKEKEIEQMRKDMKRTNELKRKERIEKAERLSERWMIFRMTTEYIDENKEEWEKERTAQEEKIKRRSKEWENKTRIEKIETIEKEERERERKVIWTKRSEEVPPSHSEKTAQPNSQTYSLLESNLVRAPPGLPLL